MPAWLSLPEGVSTYSPDVDKIFYIILVVTGVAFILTEFLLFLFAFIYRKREGVRATYTHGNSRLEVVWTVVPAVMLVFLALASRTAWVKIKGSIPKTDEEVVITASQFNWEIRYRGADGQFDTPDDVITSNDMHLPVGEPIRIHLRSKDVIHSFFLPQFRLKQDAVPGVTIDVWLQATRTGTFEIACAELCGFGHATMRGQLTVHEPGEYRAWLQEAQTAAAAQAGAGAVLPAAKPPA
jgi:cytochrome c oxidase subunit II